MAGKYVGRKAKLAWYGVKTVFRVSAAGRPVATDSDYDPKMTMVEERIVLYQSRSFAEAIRVAEKDARVYARTRHTNPYGQRVLTRYLGACDAYKLFAPPDARQEVFSSTEVISKRVSDKAVVNQYLGHEETKREDKTRRNVLNREYSGTVKRGV